MIVKDIKTIQNSYKNPKKKTHNAGLKSQLEEMSFGRIGLLIDDETRDEVLDRQTTVGGEVQRTVKTVLSTPLVGGRRNLLEGKKFIFILFILVVRSWMVQEYTRRVTPAMLHHEEVGL